MFLYNWAKYCYRWWLFNYLKINLNMETSVIAEVGVNHNGNFNLAKKIIILSKKIGVKIIKFQFYNTEKLIHPKTPLAKYQKKNLFGGVIKDQYKLLKKYELSLNEHIKLSKFCSKIGIEYCCSLFHEDDVKFVKKLGLKRIKIPSGELNNFFLLKNIARLNKKIIISTGMSTTNDIDKSIKYLIKNGQDQKKITILHCCSSYPAEIKDLNLNSIKFLNKRFKILVGFSDHSQNIETPMMAVLKGAVLIEKHITLSNRMKGPDHKSSLKISKFKKMLEYIEMAEDALGKYDKVVSKSEKKNIFFVKKSLTAKKNIKKGEKFTMENLTAKRPLSGTPIEKLHFFLGKKAKKDYKKNDLI